MPKISIDGHEVEVAQGATILDAARKLGIDVPALCFLEGYEPSTSCLACTVKVLGSNRLVPSCATRAVDGMQIESETPEVHDVRRTSLELLLSDHVGDCFAPCDFGCPAHMNVPLMLRQIAGEDLRGAIETVKRDIALPAVLGRICPAPCEKACRRAPADGAVAICLLKRYVADVDLASDDPYLPECKPSTGKRVAIIGGGPTGLAAAYYLLRDGHAVTVFDDQPALGGRLRHETAEDELPRDVLDGEIALVTRLGTEVRPSTPAGDDPSLEHLARQFDAVLVACGATKKETLERWGLQAGTRGVEINRETYETSVPGVFAAGNAIRTKGLVIRSVADGKEVAVSIDQHLAGRPVSGPEKRFSSRIGRLSDVELSEFMADASEASRSQPEGRQGFAHAEAARQAGRCLHCDCRALTTCKLRQYAERCGADPKRYGGERAPFHQSTQHSQVIYEPGKCIACGLCIEIAARAQEPLGLTFIGRGFDVRVGVPFNRPLQEALSKVAAECVAACPTAALALKEKRH
ncbi:MAG TPA: FAD-dependent oxidoreductase [Thermoguttaceae bacterium]|nr:FAD-dependent oxidoreductase [Thermoguttaceae bacterium]